MLTNKNNTSLIGSYNSLRDPHLRTHFRKPQIRRHLIKSNIINNENKIIEEISSTKHRQNLERKKRQDLYRMLLNEISLNDNFNDNLIINDKLINQAKSIVYYQNNNEQEQRINLLQKLDRMIKTIKEHYEQDNNKINQSLKKSMNKNVKCKSFHDLSTCLNQQHQQQQHQKLNHYISTPQLATSRSSLIKRPKSSYGSRTTSRSISNDSIINNHLSISLANVKLLSSVEDDDDEIKSLDGESFKDSDDDDDELDNYQPINFNLKLSPILSTPATSCSSGSSGSLINYYNKKYYAFDKRFIKFQQSDQKRIKMILRYNGLNTATNIGKKRNIKIYQQITIGGNSILIYDGYVKPGETFTFDIRPHINNSFSINILVNGIRDLRLNTCCERKHHPGKTLSNFTIVDVIGGRPCLNCQLNNYSDYNCEIKLKQQQFDNYKKSNEKQNPNDKIDSNRIIDTIYTENDVDTIDSNEKQNFNDTIVSNQIINDNNDDDESKINKKFKTIRFNDCNDEFDFTHNDDNDFIDSIDNETIPQIFD